MSEWYDSQKMPGSDFRKLLQERVEKSNPRRELTPEETRRPSKLKEVADKIRSSENV